VNQKRCVDAAELSYVGYARVNSSVFSLALKVDLLITKKRPQIFCHYADKMQQCCVEPATTERRRSRRYRAYFQRAEVTNKQLCVKYVRRVVTSRK